MEDKKVTAEEIQELLAGDFAALAKEMAEAMNSAKDGSIIADSEVLVFEANGKFRQQAFEKVIGLMQDRHEAFSPSADDAESRQADGPSRND